MGTTGSLVFTGISSFSNDFQTILQRAVSIAQLPVKSLQNQQADNLGRKQALIALNPAVANLASAVSALGAVASTGGLTTSSSDSSTVSVLNTGASTPATYTISNIQFLAAAASETSVRSYTNTTTDKPSISGHVDLVVGTNTYHLDVSAKNNLAGLRDAINTAGAGVNATIITAPGGDYLSVAASSLGATTLQLNDVPLEMVTSTGTGTETSLKTYANETTAAVSRDGHVHLVVGATTYQLDVTGNNNLDGLRDAINSANAGVTATVVQNGPDFSLEIATNDSQPATIQLKDVPTTTNLITNTNQGKDADFYLNGTIHITKKSNVINDVIPGLSFTLRATTAGSVTLSLSTDRSQLSSALQTFANNYNALVAQVNEQIGPSAGALHGDSLIRDISSDMQQLAGYWNTGSSIHSLADLGLTFDTTGLITFDSATFNDLSDSQISAAFQFIGSSQSGLAALASNFTQLSDPVSGLFRQQEDSYDHVNTKLDGRIKELNERVSLIQSGMSAKLQQADALIAQLQSQQDNLTAAIQSVNYVAFGKKDK